MPRNSHHANLERYLEGSLTYHQKHRERCSLSCDYPSLIHQAKVSSKQHLGRSWMHTKGMPSKVQFLGVPLKVSPPIGTSVLRHLQQLTVASMRSRMVQASNIRGTVCICFRPCLQHSMLPEPHPMSAAAAAAVDAAPWTRTTYTLKTTREYELQW